MAFMGRIGWQAIPFWRALCLPNGPQNISGIIPQREEFSFMDTSKIENFYNIDMDEYKNPEMYHLRCKENIWKEIRREAANESDNNQIKCG